MRQAANSSVEYGPQFWRERGARKRHPLSLAVHAFRGHEREGLCHTVWTFGSPFIGGVCNCDRSDCLAMRCTVTHGVPVVFRAEHVAEVSPDACVGCRECMPACQFGALSFSAGSRKAAVDQRFCYGCGVCRAACKKDAIRLLDRRESPVAARSWRASPSPSRRFQYLREGKVEAPPPGSASASNLPKVLEPSGGARAGRATHCRAQDKYGMGKQICLYTEGATRYVEDPDGRPRPFEIKLSKTPKPAMAAGLARFAELFAPLAPHPGQIITLSEEALPLTRAVSAVPVLAYLGQLREACTRGLAGSEGTGEV